MELVVDLARVTVVLARADELDELVVRVGAPPAASADSEADAHRLHDVLVATNVGRLVDTGRAVVRPDAVRFHAAGQVSGTWEGGFARFCRHRRPADAATATATETETEGWVQAPVAWPDDRLEGG